MLTNDESSREEAVSLLKQQLEELQTVASLNHKDAKFKSWRDTTIKVLESYLGPKSRYTTRFSSIAFSGGVSARPWGPRATDYVSQQDVFTFRRGCEMAEVALRAVIRAVEEAELPRAQPESARTGADNDAGTTQNPQAPVAGENHAPESATPNLEQVVDELGSSVKQIAALLDQSEELTRRELKEAQAHIEALTLELQKPGAARDGKLLLEHSQSILDLAAKATDVADSLAPHTPAILGVIDGAKKTLEPK